MHAHARESARAPLRGGRNTHKRGGGERDDCKEFFPFLISNLLKIETTAKSFLLNLSFSVGKRKKSSAQK